MTAPPIKSSFFETEGAVTEDAPMDPIEATDDPPPVDLTMRGTSCNNFGLLLTVRGLSGVKGVNVVVRVEGTELGSAECIPATTEAAVVAPILLLRTIPAAVGGEVPASEVERGSLTAPPRGTAGTSDGGLGGSS